MTSLRYRLWARLFDLTANFGCQCDPCCLRCRIAGRALQGMSNNTDWGDE